MYVCSILNRVPICKLFVKVLGQIGSSFQIVWKRGPHGFCTGKRLVLSCLEWNLRTWEISDECATNANKGFLLTASLLSGYI